MFVVIPYIFFIVIPFLLWKYLPFAHKSLKRKAVLITGAASGIGRQMAIHAAAKGANLILLDLNMDGLKSVKEKIQESLPEGSDIIVEVHNVDVTKENQIDKAFERFQQDVDVLINNAGIVCAKNIEEYSADEFRKVLDVNTVAPFLMVRKVLPQMKKRGTGHIVNISSIMGHVGCAKLSEYCASKHALVGFHESLRYELQRDGFSQNQIATTLVCPSAINTGMFDGLHINWLMNLLAPLLREDQVAKRVLKAVERKEHMLYLPALTSVLFPLARLLPTPLKDVFVASIGAYHGVNEQFRGRQGNSQSSVEHSNQASNGDGSGIRKRNKKKSKKA